MTVMIFTPTRHPGIAVSALSVARQKTKEKIIWAVADTLHRDWITYKCAQMGILAITNFEPVKGWNNEYPGRVGNLEAMCNWALREARKFEVELLIFLQDFIWMPPDGVDKFLKTARAQPFSLLTGAADIAAEPLRDEDARDPDWDIFAPGEVERCPYPPYEPDTRIQMGWKPGRINQHGWEINYAALPHAMINAGVDFDEDFDYGTQWGNTQFSFNIARKTHMANNSMLRDMGHVWWTPDNRSVSMPHRDYFPKTHQGERSLDNGELFWKKNPDVPRG